jgi:heptosyltransferase-2
MAWRSGAARRIGYRHELREALFTESLPRAARGDLHLSREYLALGGGLGASETPVPVLPAPPGGVRAAARLLAETGLGERRFAVLGPGALYGPAKRWPPERFVAVGAALRGAGLAIAVCGSAAERAAAEGVAASIGEGAVALAGRTDLPALAGVFARATGAVCNDSGLAHLAAAVGVVTVAVFGSTSSAWSAPLGPRVRVVQRAPVCSPCFQRTCRVGYACLGAVQVSDVLRAWEAAAR